MYHRLNLLFTSFIIPLDLLNAILSQYSEERKNNSFNVSADCNWKYRKKFKKYFFFVNMEILLDIRSNIYISWLACCSGNVVVHTDPNQVETHVTLLHTVLFLFHILSTDIWSTAAAKPPAREHSHLRPLNKH